MNDIFKKVPVQIPNKSGFDMSHENTFTTKCGTLTPALVDLMLPNDTISLRVGSQIQLPPVATDFYGRIKGHFEAFFVPLRILYGGMQEFFTHPTNGQVFPTGQVEQAKYLPTLRCEKADMGLGSLADYLGFQVDGSSTSNTYDVLNPLRFVAYHRIWDAFYRDSRIQASAFARQVRNTGGATIYSAFSNLPYYTNYDSTPSVISGTNLACADGISCLSLRQRCFGRDYFTNMTPLPQAGQPASFGFSVNTSTGQGSFSLSSLRAANALQTWLERNNIAGYRYGDQIRAHFGIYPSDAALDRPLYLGREIVDVYNKSVYQSSSPSAATASNNPTSAVGAKYASPLGVGNGTLVDKFTATEHGYIFVMFSLVPDCVYDGGVDREFFYNAVGDFPFPLLAGVGDQDVKRREISYYGSSSIDDDVIGYTQRYANHKYIRDRVHGLLRNAGSLKSFAITRAFGAGVTLGSSLLEIPTNYLDQVAAVTGAMSQFGCWVDSYFEYHKISTLPAYSIPTLGDPNNTHTEVVPNGGTRL